MLSHFIRKKGALRIRSFMPNFALRREIVIRSKLAAYVRPTLWGKK
jgi:hypothetical protein